MHIYNWEKYYKQTISNFYYHCLFVRNFYFYTLHIFFRNIVQIIVYIYTSYNEDYWKCDVYDCYVWTYVLWFLYDCKNFVVLLCYGHVGLGVVVGVGVMTYLLLLFRHRPRPNFWNFFISGVFANDSFSKISSQWELSVVCQQIFPISNRFHFKLKEVKVREGEGNSTRCIIEKWFWWVFFPNDSL